VTPTDLTPVAVFLWTKNRNPEELTGVSVGPAGASDAVPLPVRCTPGTPSPQIVVRSLFFPGEMQSPGWKLYGLGSFTTLAEPRVSVSVASGRCRCGDATAHTVARLVNQLVRVGWQVASADPRLSGLPARFKAAVTWDQCGWATAEVILEALGVVSAR
jgi:hypothetical protein